MIYLTHRGNITPVTPDGTIVSPFRGHGQEQRIAGAVTVARNGRGCVQSWTWDQIKHSPESIPWWWENGRQRTFLKVLVHGRDIALDWRQQNTFVFQREE